MNSKNVSAAGSGLAEDLEELSSAEDFLGYFAIPYDASVVQVNRLHIMQRLHDYLVQSEGQPGGLPEDDAALSALYKTLLTRAYQDFVESDARTEKVFKVFKRQEPQTGFVALDSLLQN